MAKRHKWKEISRRRSMIHNTVCRCEDCGLERAQFMDFGHHRIAFRRGGEAWVPVNRTPECLPATSSVCRGES